MSKVLDKGFVKLIDSMGDDSAVVKAARVSYGQDLKTADEDERLINFLMNNGHHNPFEHIVFKFHTKCPIFVARQLFRTRISSMNEISGRYIEFEPEYFLPDHLRKQTGKNYQYENFENKVEEKIVIDTIDKFMNTTFEFYNELLSIGVAKELARIVLPLSTYTQFYWTINFRALMNFLELRLDEHAQLEIREYAKAIEKLIENKIPCSYEAFRNHYKGNKSCSI